MTCKETIKLMLHLSSYRKWLKAREWRLFSSLVSFSSHDFGHWQCSLSIWSGTTELDTYAANNLMVCCSARCFHSDVSRYLLLILFTYRAITKSFNVMLQQRRRETRDASKQWPQRVCAPILHYCWWVGSVSSTKKSARDIYYYILSLQ